LSSGSRLLKCDGSEAHSIEYDGCAQHDREKHSNILLTSVKITIATLNNFNTFANYDIIKILLSPNDIIITPIKNNDYEEKTSTICSTP